MRAAVAAVLVATFLVAAPSAQGDFGFLPGTAGFKVTATEEDGSIANLAGSHPHALTTEINLELDPASEAGGSFTDGDLRNLHIDLPAGLIENPAAVPDCSQAQFHTPRQSPFGASLSGENCPASTQVGVIAIRSSFGIGSTRTFGVFNLEPPPGFPSQLGFSPYGAPITLTPHIREAGSEYGLTLDLRNFPQQLNVSGLRMTLWGTPWNVGHNGERGNCLNEAEPDFPHAKCSVGTAGSFPRLAYLTLPASCEGPLVFRASADSWQQPAVVTALSSSENDQGEPEGLQDCDSLSFDRAPIARLSTERAGSASGLEFVLDGEGETLIDPKRRVSSQVKKAVVTLPEGVTINPSVGSGLGFCTPGQFAAETVSSPPGAGCPNASKIGVLSVKSPLFQGAVEGGLFLAQPDDPATGEPGAENPFDSLLALYLVAKASDRGVMVRVAGKVTADPDSGQLVASFDDLPQLPYTHFDLRFRDGQRSPLATPAACGSYVTQIELSPWLDPDLVRHATSTSQLSTGIGGGSCPSGSTPFTPQAQAGTLNRNAGSYTPYYLHLTRTDAEQEITSYSAKLPPGLLGKLTGVPYCPEAAIAAAKLKSGFEEITDPSCPASSSIGRTYSGYGLGSVLAYAPGGLFLAGPYHGAPLSIVAIDAATVGPFDLGVIVVRSAIRVDRQTAQVSVDSAGSDPIPHIVEGIPLHLRDVRVYIDRPNFTLNPTSCEHFATSSFLNGSGERVSDPADDSLAGAASPFQVSNCSALDFSPRFAFTLRGGIKRGDYPALTAVVRPRPGDANLGKVTVTLPPEEFLAQEHLDTICTRVQFEAERCPPGSVYGHAKAFTPLLAEPLEGPVYLRSNGNERPLPDLVASIRGAGISIDVVGRIGSSHNSDSIRATFGVLPDAPVSKFVVNMNGGKRGILANAGNVCSPAVFAKVRIVGQNNRGALLEPKLSNSRCTKAKPHRAKQRGAHG